jgi:hydroxymethylbilane synthase
MHNKTTIHIATRGSALALAQANMIAAQLRSAFPERHFELKIIKTTGDKLQKASMAQPDASLPKGLFTKELEVALLAGEADLAVHSLKDLPTDLPAGLILAATPKREDVRDVLIYRAAGELADQKARRGLKPHASLEDFPKGATIATSSTRRKAQLQVVRPDMKKVAENLELDATVLALAGLTRLNFTLSPDGTLHGEAVPEGLLATVLEVDVMLPCVGQAAIGIEIRADDERTAKLCERLNHLQTFRCVTAERAFLSGMGGGCQSPVAAYAEISDEKIHMCAVSFRDGPGKHTSGERLANEAQALGEQLAAELK